MPASEEIITDASSKSGFSAASSPVTRFPSTFSKLVRGLTGKKGGKRHHTGSPVRFSKSLSLRTDNSKEGHRGWRKRLSKVTESAPVQVFILAVIVFDLAFSIYSIVKDKPSPGWVDGIVLIVLTLDIGIRLLIGVRKFFKSPLNVFEFAVVIVCYVFFFLDSKNPTASARLAGRIVRGFRPVMLAWQQRHRVLKSAQRSMEKKVVRMIEQMMGDIWSVRSENVTCNPIDGTLNVQDAIIKADTLEELHLPLTVTGGFVERIHVTLPVLPGMSKDAHIRIEVSNMLILLGPTVFNSTYWDTDSIRRRKQNFADIIAKRIELLGYKKTSTRLKGMIERAKARVLRIMRTQYIDIQNITFRYEDSREYSERFACGVKLGQFLLRPIQDMAKKSPNLDQGRVAVRGSDHQGSTQDLDYGPAGTDARSTPKTHTQALQIHRLAAFWDLLPSVMYVELFERRPAGPAELFKHYTSVNLWERLKLHVVGELQPLFSTRPRFRERLDQHLYVVYPIEIRGRITWGAVKLVSVPVKFTVRVPQVHVKCDSRQLHCFNHLLSDVKEWMMEDDIMITRPSRSISHMQEEYNRSVFGKSSGLDDQQDSPGTRMSGRLSAIRASISSSSLSSAPRNSSMRSVLSFLESTSEDTKEEAYRRFIASWWKHAVRATQLRLKMAPKNFSALQKEAIIAQIAPSYVDLLIQEYFLDRVSHSKRDKNKKKLEDIQLKLPVTRIIRLRMKARSQIRELLSQSNEFNETDDDDGLVEEIAEINTIAVETKSGFVNDIGSTVKHDLEAVTAAVTGNAGRALRSSITNFFVPGQGKEQSPSNPSEASEASGATEEADADSDSDEDDEEPETLDAATANWSHVMEMDVTVDSIEGTVCVHSMWGWVLSSCIRRIYEQEVRRQFKARRRTSTAASKYALGLSNFGAKLHRRNSHVDQDEELSRHDSTPGDHWRPGKCGGFGFEHFGQRTSIRPVFLRATIEDVQGRVCVPPEFLTNRRGNGIATAILSCATATIVEEKAPDALKKLLQVEQFLDEGQEVCGVMRISAQYDEVKNRRSQPPDMQAAPSQLTRKPEKKTTTGSKLARSMSWTRIRQAASEANKKPTLTKAMVKEAFTKACYVVGVRLAPVKMIHFQPAIEKLSTMLRSGRLISQGLEDFLSVTKTRMKLRRTHFVESTLEKLQNKIKQRILVCCVFERVQIESFQRYSKSQMFATSFSLPSVNSSVLWLGKGELLSTQLNMGTADIDMMHMDPAAYVDLFANKQHEVEEEEDLQQSVSSEFRKSVQSRSKVQNMIGIDHGSEESAEAVTMGSMKTVREDSETAAIANEGMNCWWCGRPGQEACCAGEGWSMRMRPEWGPRLRSPRPPGVGLLDLALDERTPQGYYLEEETIPTSAPSSVRTTGRRLSTTGRLPQHACSRLNEPVAATEFSEACSVWNGTLNLWQALPWQVSMRLVAPSDLGLKIGNAAARGEDFKFLGVSQRRSWAGTGASMTDDLYGSAGVKRTSFKHVMLTVLPDTGRHYGLRMAGDDRMSKGRRLVTWAAENLTSFKSRTWSSHYQG